VFKKLGTKQIDQIKRSEINALLDKIEEESGTAMADHTLAYLRRVFNWHAARGGDDEFRSPFVRDMARGSAKNKRDRTLTDDELRAFWRTAESWDHPFSHMVRFILLTAVRRDEAADMPWAELDGDLWTIPAVRYKTDLDFELPLSEAAQGVLAVLAKQGRNGYVFTTDGGNTPFSQFSGGKWDFDDKMLAELRRIAAERDNDPALLARIAKVEELRAKIAALKKGDTRPRKSAKKPQSKTAAANAEACRKLAKELKAIWWTIHDLRRTARTLMTQAGVDTDHAERALGHKIGGVRGVYDRASYRKEKRAAFKALAERVGEIVGKPLVAGPSAPSLTAKAAA
jgi:integrase